MAHRLLERSGYVGVAEMEMKRHGQTGELHAIEVNPRIWSQVTLPAVLGINFALWYCRIATGAAFSEESQAAPVPCAWQDLWGDLYWTFGRGGYWRHGEVSLREWVKQTLASRAHAYFAWNDPAPGIRRAWDGIASAVRGGARP
jgi:predicted ATP-grasp superfamily ATP-dependent carboligase